MSVFVEGPDASAQFRNRASADFSGGYGASCGNHPSLPKQHRWGPWNVRVMPNPKYIGRDRICKTCALWSDVETKLNDGKGFSA